MKIPSKIFTLAIITLLALIALRLYTTKAAPKPTQFWTPGCVATIPTGGANSKEATPNQAWPSRTTPARCAS